MFLYWRYKKATMHLKCMFVAFLVQKFRLVSNMASLLLYTIIFFLPFIPTIQTLKLVFSLLSKDTKHYGICYFYSCRNFWNISRCKYRWNSAYCTAWKCMISGQQCTQEISSHILKICVNGIAFGDINAPLTHILRYEIR